MEIQKTLAFTEEEFRGRVARVQDNMAAAGLRIREGDVRCLASGHLARLAVVRTEQHWNRTRALSDRLREAEVVLQAIADEVGLDRLVLACLHAVTNGTEGRRRASDCRPDPAP